MFKLTRMRLSRIRLIFPFYFGVNWIIFQVIFMCNIAFIIKIVFIGLGCVFHPSKKLKLFFK